jgi:hypothetical protein
LNFLVSVRTYLDHTETKIKKEFGKESVQWKRVKAACSAEYDGFFAYRFLYRLRNYVQHCGAPPSIIHSSANLADRESKEVKRAGALYLTRDRLLEDYDGWGEQVAADLRSLPEDFDIMPYVVTMMECLTRIAIVVVKDELPELARKTQFLVGLLKEVDMSLGEPAIVELDIAQLRDQKTQMHFEWIPYHRVDEMLYAFSGIWPGEHAESTGST